MAAWKNHISFEPNILLLYKVQSHANHCKLSQGILMEFAMQADCGVKFLFLAGYAFTMIWTLMIICKVIQLLSQRLLNSEWRVLVYQLQRPVDDWSRQRLVVYKRRLCIQMPRRHQTDLPLIVRRADAGKSHFGVHFDTQHQWRNTNGQARCVTQQRLLESILSVARAISTLVAQCCWIFLCMLYLQDPHLYLHAKWCTIWHAAGCSAKKPKTFYTCATN